MNKRIYNKLPEGYVPVPKVDKSKEMKLLKFGGITEITLDGKTFQVHDARRAEQMIQLIEKHEESLFSIRQELSQSKRKVQQLTLKVNELQNTVTRLQEQIKNAGLDRF